MARTTSPDRISRLQRAWERTRAARDAAKADRAAAAADRAAAAAERATAEHAAAEAELARSAALHQAGLYQDHELRAAGIAPYPPSRPGEKLRQIPFPVAAPEPAAGDDRWFGRARDGSRRDVRAGLPGMRPRGPVSPDDLSRWSSDVAVPTVRQVDVRRGVR